MAVTHDASTSFYDDALNATQDFNGLTVGAGADRALVVGLTWSDPTQTFSLTWDQGGTNQAMTLIGSANAVGGTGRVDWYGLVAPTSGARTLRLTVSGGGGGEVFIVASAWAGVNQTGGATSFANFVSATGSSTTSSVTITSATGNATIDMSSGPQVMSAPTQTQIFVNNSGAVTSAGSSRAAGASTVAHQWTLAGAVQWVAAGVNIVAAGAATLEQEGFRWGVDDDAESAHTFEAAQDTNISIAANQSRLLRVLVDTAGDAGNTAYTLRSQKNGSGGYVAVPIGSSTKPTPLIEAADATQSGNNTASSSWTTVAYPNAVTGDLLIFGISWDDSTATTGVTPPSGPNGETLTAINATPATDAGTETRSKVWYTVATGTWTAGNLTFTPTASESWTAACIRVPAGEFDAATPIGASATNGSAGATEQNIQHAGSFSAGASDGGGRLCVWTSADDDPQTVASGFSQAANTDRGVVSGGFYTRNTAVTNSESFSATTVATIASDSWSSVAFVVRAPTVNNEVYINTSANITGGGEATTARLTAPSGKTTSDFTTGRRWDNENGSDSIDIAEDFYTEVEWLVALSSAPANDDYFDFRVYAGAAALDTYTVTPRWTVSSGSITGSGTPAAQAATVAGTATATGSASASGTPSAQAATASGTAERTVDDNGSAVELVAQAATVAGTANLAGEVTGSGTTTAQSATVSGTAERSVKGAGAPSAQPATTAGTAERSVKGSGTPAAQAATAAGTAERSVTASGTPAAQAASTEGAGTVGNALNASGTPSAQSATVAGTAERSVTASGTPSAQASTASGTAERVVTSAGTPSAQAATVVGGGTVGDVIGASGTPTAQAASAAGTAERSVTSSGTPAGQAATVAGSASVSGEATASGALSAQAASTAGTAERAITGAGTASAQSATVLGYDVLYPIRGHRAVVTAVRMTATVRNGTDG